ncbi:MAG: DUF481 domain-containing protein [Gammaproteobacteria bacterium]|nr:DUF481 domain-containing protein [Gammaproteobacteria bacterium]
MTNRTIPALAFVLFALPVLAQEEGEDGPWSGTATLGYLATSGNTENSNLNAGITVGYTSGRWAHLLATKAIHSADNDVTTAEAYEFGWKSEFSINEYDYLFGRVDWRKDRFSSYDAQVSETVGYGRRLIDREFHKLNAEIGAGARQSDLVDGTSESEFVVRAGMDYTWLISDTSEFVQTLTAEAGDTNTYLESITALKARLVGELALVASYTVKHNTDVLPLTEKTDTYSALSLEYTF